MAEESPAEEPVVEEPVAEEPVAEESPAEEPVVEEPVAEEPVAEESPAEEPVVEEPVAEEPVAEEPAPATRAAVEPAPAAVEADAVETVVEGDAVVTDDDLEEDADADEAPAPRVRPEIPGADLEVDIVREGEDALRAEREAAYEEGLEDVDDLPAADGDVEQPQTITEAAIDLAAGARYRATGKRKTAVGRVILKPGDGAYLINGRTLEQHFPRLALQRQIRQPLETVGYEERMDVVASMHGGGVSAQAGALRHGISRALIEADPNLRGELKRRGFLTRDARVKERKKAGLKKARKRPQFSKR